MSRLCICPSCRKIQAPPRSKGLKTAELPCNYCNSIGLKPISRKADTIQEDLFAPAGPGPHPDAASLFLNHLPPFGGE